MGVVARVRRQDPRPVPAHGRVARLPADAFHDGRRLHPRGDAVLRASVRPRLDLSGQSDHQLVPLPPNVALGSRAHARRRRRHAVDDPLPSRRRRRLHPDRDRPAGDDSRRRRGGRASRRRALSPSGRTRGRGAVGRATRARDRRRAGRARVRHRRAEDHAGPRSDRLRDRPRSRAAGADVHRARRPRHGGRGSRRADAGGGRGEDPRLAEGAWPARAARALPAQRGALRALREPHRAADLAAVVVLDGRAEASTARGAPEPRGALPPREPAPLRDRLARERAGLVRVAAALVGPSASRLVLPGRPRDGRGDGAVRVRGVRLDLAPARDGRARHVVLVGSLAVRDARLARRHGGPPLLLPGRTCRRRRARSSASGRTA